MNRFLWVATLILSFLATLFLLNWLSVRSRLQAVQDSYGVYLQQGIDPGKRPLVAAGPDDLDLVVRLPIAATEPIEGVLRVSLRVHPGTSSRPTTADLLDLYFERTRRRQLLPERPELTLPPVP